MGDQEKVDAQQQAAQAGIGGVAEGEDMDLREEDVQRGDALDDRVSEGELPGDGE